MWKLIEERAEELVCAVLISAMATIVLYAVINRSIFGHAVAWADEVAIYCLVWSTYLGGALAVRERVHIRVLNGILAFPKPLSTWLVYLSDLIWVAFNITLVYQGYRLVEFMWAKP
ncbi:MAG: TRAP transporter small permease subunit, partial [Alphaproteobacteria bacterium]|nr:TRAP transporter small permease subunit [Alphaproteobacteria bacterium]